MRRGVVRRGGDEDVDTGRCISGDVVFVDAARYREAGGVAVLCGERLRRFDVGQREFVELDDVRAGGKHRFYLREVVGFQRYRVFRCGGAQTGDDLHPVVRLGAEVAVVGEDEQGFAQSLTVDAASGGEDGSGGEFARVRDAFARAGNGGLWIDGAGACKHVGEVLRDAAAPFQHELRHFPALMHLRGAALRLQDEAARLGVRTVGEVDVRRQAEFA